MSLLDSPEVTRGGERIAGPALRGPRGIRCLAALAERAGRPVAREQLADAVWGDPLPPSWRNNLRTLVSHLRTALGDTTIEGTPDGYQLQIPEELVDLVALRHQVARVEASAAPQAWALASAVLPVTEGQPMRGHHGAWVESVRAEVGDLRRRLVQSGVSAALELGRHRDAERLARDLVADNPLREDAHRLLMRTHVAAGNLGLAVAAYEECRQVLDESLGMTPSPQTEALFLELLRTPGEGTSPPPHRRRSVAYAMSNAQEALASQGYAEAALAASRGLALLDAGDDDPAARHQLATTLASARRHLGDPEGRLSLRRLIAEALGRGDAQGLASAALALTGGGFTSDEAWVDDSLLETYQATLEALHPDDLAQRGRVLGHLATALSWRQDGPTGRATAELAEDAARRSGDDAALLSTLWSRRRAVGGTLDVALQQRIDGEMIQLGRASGDPTAQARALMHAVVTNIERGRDADLESLLDQAVAAGREAQSAASAHSLGYTRAALALLRGDLVAATVLAEEAASAGRTAGLELPVVEAIRLVQMLAVWEENEQVAAHRDHLVGFFGAAGLPEWSSVVARVEAIAGEREVACEHLRRYVDRTLETGPTMINPVALMAWSARTVLLLGDATNAARLYPVLAPYSGLGSYVAHFAGPVDLALAELALTTGERELAARHASAAVDFCARLGAPLLQARAERLRG